MSQPVSEKIRVTGTVQRESSTLIKAVPVLSSGTQRSARYSIQVWAKDKRLSVEPAPGQIWQIEGTPSVQKIEVGNYLQEVHIYKRPTRVVFILPNTGETFIQFIAKDPAFKGIGEAKARTLWEAFGTRIHTMLTEESSAEAREAFAPYLSETSINALFAGYEKYANLQHTVWMSNQSIPANVQRRVIKYHEENVVQVLQRNPYELIHFGMSYAQVKALVERTTWTECPDMDEQRIRAAAYLGLNRALRDGSTYASVAQVHNSINVYLKNAEETQRAMTLICSDENIALHHAADQRIHPTATAVQELAVAKRFKALASRTRVLDAADEAALAKTLRNSAHQPTDQQLEAVKLLLTTDIGCLTGGAGTGKTFTCNTFLQTSIALGYEVFAVALSGRAAMRLHESIGLVTSTIARFLRDDAVACEASERKLLLIDEASMVDLPTMFKLINHISPYVKIIFTGDPNQLPPIGAGKILHDLVNSGAVSNATLDVVKRQEGSTGIPEYTASIKDGIVPSSLNMGNIHFHETDAKQLQATAIQLYAQSPQTTKIIASTRATVEAMNALIQTQFNAQSPRLEFTLSGESQYLDLRLGDEVLFTQNHYHLGIQNGTLGRLVSVTQKDTVLGQVRTDSGDLVELTEGLLDAIQLGYAITLHKAQGSQFKRIIVVLEENRITDRSWLYTAITRAETEVHILGSAETFAKVTQAEPTAFKRKTLLAPLMNFVV